LKSEMAVQKSFAEVMAKEIPYERLTAVFGALPRRLASLYVPKSIQAATKA
jgi:hypothetical protein